MIDSIRSVGRSRNKRAMICHVVMCVCSRARRVSDDDDERGASAIRTSGGLLHLPMVVLRTTPAGRPPQSPLHSVLVGGWVSVSIPRSWVGPPVSVNAKPPETLTSCFHPIAHMLHSTGTS